MKKIILHIGRHKSGTSALQGFLDNNQDALMKFGYHYPTSGRFGNENAHHGIAHYLESLGVLSNDSNQAFSEEDSEFFIDEINKCEDTLIVSSEVFSRIHPEKVVAVFDPKITEVVIYLREPVDYLLSSYSQAIHNQTITHTLSEFEKEVFRIDYFLFLSKWAKVYGKDSIKVRLFSSEHLKNQDIIDDFMDLIGIQDVTEHGFVKRNDYVNVSIGGNLLEFKRIVNSLGFSQQYLRRRLYGQLSNLAQEFKRYRSKPIVTVDFQEFVRSKHRSSNLALFFEYFDSDKILFKEKDFSFVDGKSNKEIEARKSRDFLHIQNWLSEKDPKFYEDFYNKVKSELLERQYT